MKNEIICFAIFMCVCSFPYFHMYLHVHPCNNTKTTQFHSSFERKMPACCMFIHVHGVVYFSITLCVAFSAFVSNFVCYWISHNVSFYYSACTRWDDDVDDCFMVLHANQTNISFFSFFVCMLLYIYVLSLRRFAISVVDDATFFVAWYIF